MPASRTVVCRCAACRPTAPARDPRWAWRWQTTAASRDWPLARAPADEPGDARHRDHRQRCDGQAGGQAAKRGKRGTPIPVMRDNIGHAAASKARPMPTAINVSPSAPMLRNRPIPDPSAMAPTSASGPPTLGRSSTTVSGRNATPSLSIRTASQPTPSAAAAPRRRAANCRRFARPSPRRRCRRARHPPPPHPLPSPRRQRRTGGIHLLGGGMLGIVDATPGGSHAAP